MPDMSPEAIAKRKEESILRRMTCKEVGCTNKRQAGSGRCYEHRKDAPKFSEGFETV